MTRIKIATGVIMTFLSKRVTNSWDFYNLKLAHCVLFNFKFLYGLRKNFVIAQNWQPNCLTITFTINMVHYGKRAWGRWQRTGWFLKWCICRKGKFSLLLIIAVIMTCKLFSLLTNQPFPHFKCNVWKLRTGPCSDEFYPTLDFKLNWLEFYFDKLYWESMGCNLHMK